MDENVQVRFGIIININIYIYFLCLYDVCGSLIAKNIKTQKDWVTVEWLNSDVGVLLE